MPSEAALEAGLILASQIVSAILKAAPAITAGVASSAPYVKAIAGMLAGTNATQADIDALLLQANRDSEDFQTPLPPDDGTTTT